MRPLQPHLCIHDWLSLDNAVRNKLIEIFNIPKSGGVVMQDNVCLSDGHTAEDLAVVTVELMRKHLGTPLVKDFYALLNTVIDMIEHPIVVIAGDVITREEAAQIVPGAIIRFKSKKKLIS